MEHRNSPGDEIIHTAPAQLSLEWSRTRLKHRYQIAAASALVTALGAPAFAAQSDITISTAAPPATPQIHGAVVVGSIPGSPFLHTVSATGQAPLTFAATGLPSGLSIDSSSGTISGTAPAAGSYPISVTVTNGSGSVAATLTLIAGSTLALTPPMGWNSYDSFYADVKESDVLAAAEAMKKVLQPYGWDTVVIDYLWYDPEKKRDANGRWLPSPSKYPSATGEVGFKPIADKVHALGLKFGIHLMRGIPRASVTANDPIADSSYTASQAGNTGDTCAWDDHMYGVRADTEAGKAWYDSIYGQYASWDVDFVKVDDMMNPYGGNAYHGAEVEAVHNSIVKSGRSMVLSLSPGPNQTRDVASLNANANMWRTVNDFWDTNGLSSLDDEFDAANSWANTNGITPGHWPDADMLPLGTIGNRQCAFSHNQQVTVMTLWSIMPSPLMFGGMPIKLSGDTWTIALLTNEEVLAVNQDPLGSRGKRLSQQGSTEVWARDLSGGRKAVALFNRGTQDATVSVTFSQLGMTGTPTVRDLWHKEDLTEAATQISVNVPHEGALMYTVTPVGAGTGGTGGAGGTSGAGGASTDGTSGSGGAISTGGTGDSGGTSGSGGRSSAGGRSSTGGRSGNPGGGPAAGGTEAGGGSSSNVGGTAGAGGTAVVGGSTAAGGIAAGAPATGGTASGGQATGGSALGGTQAGGTAAGGAPSGGAATGGLTTSSSGAAAAGAEKSGADDESGCSCTLPSRDGLPGRWLLSWLALGLAVCVRRRGTPRARRAPALGGLPRLHVVARPQRLERHGAACRAELRRRY
jgi:alpha-galactosidase